jgi:alpha,alpha-trehalose phosphorylase
MGAAWMVFVYGFAGMHDHEGRLTFQPNLSPRIERIRFPLTVHNQVLEVDVNHHTATYTLRQGEDLEIRHQGRLIHLTAEKPQVKLPLKPTRHDRD